jgi:hypothetical protein
MWVDHPVTLSSSPLWLTLPMKSMQTCATESADRSIQPPFDITEINERFAIIKA